MFVYPSLEYKSVKFHPCDSRVGKLAVMCGTSLNYCLFSKYGVDDVLNISCFRAFC